MRLNSGRRLHSLLISMFLTGLLGQDAAAALSTLVPLSSVRASAVDGSGNIYLAGETASDVIPVTPNAFQRKFAGGAYSHAFVVKISADGTRILYATYLEGSTGSD